jgi:hypothetical protein
VGNIPVGILGLDVGWNARVLGAVTTGGAGLALLLRRVDGVEPEHVGVMLQAGWLAISFLFSSQRMGAIMASLTSSQMDMTRTMGRRRAALSWLNPPTSEKRLRSPKAVNCLEQKSGVISLVLPRLVSVGPGMTNFLPSWTRNWVSLFWANWLTTL